MKVEPKELLSIMKETIISNNDFGLNRGPVFCPPSQPPSCYYELSHTEGLMFTWSEQRCTEIFFIFCSSSVTKILSLMLLCSEFMGLGHGTHTRMHAHAHTHSQQSCSASTPCNPSDKLQRLSSSSFLLLHLPHSTLSFQLQLDLDKDGFSFSSLFFPALAKEGFARGDYTQTQMHAHRLQRGDIAFEEKHLH